MDEKNVADGLVAPRFVHLPTVISDNFGLSGIEARRLMLVGTVKIAGHELPHNTVSVPFEQINHQRVEVVGDLKTLRFVYHADEA